MTQQSCLDDEGYATSCAKQPPEDVLPSRHVLLPAVIFLVVLVVALGLFDMWALKTHHDRVSSLFRKFFRGHPLRQVLGVIGSILFVWHLIWTFPW